MDLVQTKPGTTTDLQEPDPLVSTEQTTQHSLQEANGSQQCNSRISINDVRPTNCSQERSSPDIVTDIEGLKLDFLILLKQIKENTRLLSTIMSKSKTKMPLVPNSMIAKRGVKRYYPLCPKKTMQSRSWKKNA